MSAVPRPFRLSREAYQRREERDNRDGGDLHRSCFCCSDTEMCCECYDDVVAELVSYISRQRQRLPTESAGDYYSAVGGPPREGWLTVVSYLDGKKYAVQAVRQAQAFRREEVACV